MPYTPILATLGYVMSRDGTQALMIHRNTRPGDMHLGKYNGLGGKMEPEEDALACMHREIREEAGIECGTTRLRGTLSWPGFGKHGEDWFAFVFVIDDSRVQTRDALFDADPRPFHGVMPYRDGRMQSWSYSRL